MNHQTADCPLHVSRGGGSDPYGRPFSAPGGSVDPVCVYRSTSPVEVWLMRDLLKRGGVAVEVRGEATLGLAGLIPALDAAPSLWVDRKVEARSRGLIQTFEAQNNEAEAWGCRCGVEVDGHFGSCWSCGRDRP